MTTRYLLGSVICFFVCGSTNAQTADDFDPGCDGFVNSLAVQADGKVLVGGQFTTLGGQARVSMGRLNADGVLDSGFNPGVEPPFGSAQVYSLAVQTDGKILLAGVFTGLGGQGRTNIGRLNADGSVDSGFNPGANNRILSLAVQADGKILVGGSFVTLGGQARNRIGRLNMDGSLDSSFIPVGANAEVACLALQPDGKILVCGAFSMLAGQACSYIARLNANGSFDSSFNRDVSYSNTVYSLAIQVDGKILLGGGFTRFGLDGYCIRRLNANGSLDSSLTPIAYDEINSLALQTDGKILAGGDFYKSAIQPRIYVGRFNTNGSLDSSFNSGANSTANCLALQSDGKVVAGGAFSALGGQTRNRIGRLNNIAPATQDFIYDGSKLLWQRGGTSPEVWRTTFEVTTNGADWISLGAGERVPAGWQSPVVGLTTNHTVRARGFVAGGIRNASSWFVETRWHSKPRLGIGRPVNGVFALTMFGNVGETLELRAATNTAGPWWPVQSFVLTNSTETLLWTNQSEAVRYFRVEPQ